MDDEFNDNNYVFNQDGVQLRQAPSTYINFINITGSLYICESTPYEEGHAKKRVLIWKPNDVTIDSDVQDQEWAVVNTVQKRIRTLSGNLPSDYHNRLRNLKIPFDEIKSFRISSKNRQLTFFDGSSELTYSFFFLHGNCDMLVGTLKSTLKLGPSRRDKHLFVVYDANSPEYQELNKTFAALDLKSESSLFTMFKNIKEHPYEGSLEAFSKVTNYVYRCVDQGDFADLPPDDLNRSLSEFEESTTHSGGDYEVIQKLPELPKRKDFPRCEPLNEEVWKALFNSQGQLEDVQSIKTIIFRGGVSPNIRQEVWKFLLDYYPWNSTSAERVRLTKEKSNEYYVMKLQWKSMTKVQEQNFTDFAQRKSLIEKDVNRTDRNLDFYAGDNNFNLQTLNDILMTYVMRNFDLGYVQGMSDLLSPILMLIKTESDSFWCFEGFMNKLLSNFDIDQAGMKEQLSNLHLLLSFVDPTLANYLDTHDCGNMFFCFRWLLVWFKRELSQEDVMRFWEVLWTGYPCENFHLVVAVAILEQERAALMENNYGFTEILKYINELSGKLDMTVILNKAEGIFEQMREAEHLTDNIRFILGLPLLGNSNSSHEPSPKPSPFDSSNAFSNGNPSSSEEPVRISPDEVSFERSLSSNFL
ncbi:TBC1 domain family member 15 [Anthonomus grandis grandis]|uniref:TBC1 domain family member 15 n=1 Tax=Anthonomus grandis grandis TaxID=2921223 RepID=UPI00216639A8|nr:TBC1 domain family member 15 [Anthonomus grandis grandis]